MILPTLSIYKLLQKAGSLILFEIMPTLLAARERGLNSLMLDMEQKC